MLFRPGRSSSARPYRSEGGLARPFTTSSGKPRAGGARPSSKPGQKDRSPSSGWKSAPAARQPLVWSGTEPRLRTALHRSSHGLRLPPGAGRKRSYDGPSTGFKRNCASPRPSSSSRPYTPREEAEIKRPTQDQSPTLVPPLAPKEKPAEPAGSPRPIMAAPANPRPGATRNQTDSPNPAIRASPPGPNGQALPAERSALISYRFSLSGSRCSWF